MNRRKKHTPRGRLLVVGRAGGEPVKGDTVRRGYAVRTGNVDDPVS